MAVDECDPVDMSKQGMREAGYFVVKQIVHHAYIRGFKF